ncbi:MAG: hypothetical protein QW290_09330 [Sulfolobales archaeon]
MGRSILTSFRVDEDLWRKARIYAIENGLTMKELVEALLKMELEEKRLSRSRGG